MRHDLEERYIVIKLKHLEPAEVAAYRKYLAKSGLDPVDCVVVERKWPMYDRVCDEVLNAPYTK